MNTTPTLSLIAAVARNGAIGKDNTLIWRDPVDMAHFRSVTRGHPVLMGRKTWDSLPPRFRPLPDRLNIVLTRDAAWHAEGALPAATLDDALRGAAPASKVFVIGGAALYALAMPQASELVLTEIEADLDGHVYFPDWNRASFRETARDRHVDAHGVPYSFVTYKRLGGD